MRPLALLLLLAGCATVSSREELLRRPRAETDGLCAWRGARWEDNGELLAPRGGFSLGRARRAWDGDRWAGALVTAVLRDVGPLHVLEGRWFGEGLSVQAEVEVGEQAVLRLYAPGRLGRAGLVLAGAPVRVFTASEGSVVVGPPDDVFRDFKPAEVPVLEVDCAGLTLQGAPLREPVEVLTKSGFPASAEPRALPEGHEVDALAAPGGTVVGRFSSAAGPVEGFVVERRASLARFVVPTTHGVVWVGWVPESVLSPPGPRGAVPAEPRPRPRPRSSRGEWRRCSDELSVSLWAGEAPLDLGQLSARVSFEVGARHDELVEVRPEVGWLELSPELSLAVPESVVRCPRENERTPAAIEDDLQ